MHEPIIFAKPKQQEDIRILALTWNMARKPNNVNVAFEQLIPNPKHHEVVILCLQEQYKSKRQLFIDRLTNYMATNGFTNIGNISMWELQLITFIKNSKKQMIKGKIYTSHKACGVGNIIGNKGAVQMHFNLNDRSYNIFGCHLLHGQNNRVKRDEMMEEIIREMKVERPDLDVDILCDYNFIMGDLNYRFDLTFEEMIDNDKIKIAPQLID